MNINELNKLKKQNEINELKRQAIKKRGIVPSVTSNKYDIERLTKERKSEAKNKNKIVQKYSRSVKPISLKSNKKIKKIPNRNLEKLPYKSALVSLANKKITKLNLPIGSFNAGIAPYQNKYVCVYRPDEYSFKGCYLNKNYQVCEGSHHLFKFSNCADPRLIWVDNNTKLLMVYSSTSGLDIKKECIRGTIIMDLNKSDRFIDTEQFRISPEGDERHKNWMPFVHENKIYLISHVCPHKIYELDLNIKICDLKYENKWFSPWPIKENLRGNTNAVKLKDGNYLSIFHTATWVDGRCHYDNGAYIFEGKPPFKVLKCSNRTILPAEDAVEPHFRKANSILCNFPVGLIVEEEKVIISYGDNDSAVKILETSLDELEALMLEVY